MSDDHRPDGPQGEDAPGRVESGSGENGSDRVDIEQVDPEQVGPEQADPEPNTPGPTATVVPRRDRWRSFGAPMLAALIIPTLCLGVLLGWLAFGERSPGDTSVDAGFARDMSEHHAQATQMSVLVMSRSDDEAVQRVAQDIINNQEFERGMMATWLEDWGLPRARDGERMQWMSGHDHADMDLAAGVTMPGMASPSEIQALTDSSGQEAEVLFMQLMTTHHIAGVEMAEAALGAQDPRVVAAAERMINAQEWEIRLMADMLAERGAEPREDVEAWLAGNSSGAHDAHDGEDHGDDDASTEDAGHEDH